MKAAEIRQKYLDFFRLKEHQIIPSASLIPENDPSTLFTSSGMQPLVPYLLGESHPYGIRLVNSQKCFRAGDIDEVGDGRHNTFFEMLGNWSLGDYFKEEQLAWIFEFLTKTVALDPSRLYITAFRGNPDLGVPRDEESVKIWQKLFNQAGIEAKTVNEPEKEGLNGGRIFYYGEGKNWWSRSGTPDKMPVGEIGGCDTEMFYDLGKDRGFHENSPWKDKACHINCDCGRFIEIGNSVFIEYKKTEKGFVPLEQKNVDFGGGLERMAMVSENMASIFETDLFSPLIAKISQLSGGKEYKDNKVAFEIIADHIKAATFLIGDGRITPSNTDQGYVVRRLIRRAVRYGQQIGISQAGWTKEIAKEVIGLYKDIYGELDKNSQFIFDTLSKEEEKFAKTLEQGIERLEKLFSNYTEHGGNISDFSLKGNRLFDLYQSYGFPIELSFEEIDKRRKQGGGQALREEDKKKLLDDFQSRLKKHQELSRTAAAGKFKGGLADHSEATTRLHTAAHLLLAALRKVLGDHVEQRGSNITAERLRFDFSHGEKMTDEQKAEVERLVNDAISRKLPVTMEEIPLAEAKDKGASGVFDSKYGEVVKVYKMGDFSYEICGGPHVKNTGDLSGQFKIKKEESSSAGVRRIKAVLV